MVKVLVGLGNPGAKYSGTRHNIGFNVLDRVYAKFGSGSVRESFKGKLATAEIENNKLLLVWPQTFMNLSGRCVSAVANFYKVNLSSELLIVCDDLSLPLGKIRIRPKGSAGGQKGLADILAATGSQDVPRLRIGIDPVPDNWETTDYVLSRFRVEEQSVVNDSIDRAVLAVKDWCTRDLQYCMNQYNQ